MDRGPKVARELKFCGRPRKGPDFQASITIFERYCQGRIKGAEGLKLTDYSSHLINFRRYIGSYLP